MGLRVGIYDHLGWAIAVTATPGHEVVDKRRIELLEPGVPKMPIHHPPKGASHEEIEALVARVRASAGRASAEALDTLATELSSPVASVHLRVLPDDFPSDIATLLRPPYDARADAVMYRRVVAATARERGWAVDHYAAKTAEAAAAELLGERAEAVLRGPRERLGPPWNAEHRTALAATILASV